MHVVWAGLIALVIWATNLLNPVDQFAWAVQTALVEKQASGDLVLLTTEEDFTDASFPERRKDLAAALDSLRAAGSERVFIDGVFAQPSTAEADAELNHAMRKWGNNLSLVNNYRTEISGEGKFDISSPAISAGIPEVGAHRFRNFMNLIWKAEYSLRNGSVENASLPAVMANVEPHSGDFPIFYGFSLDSITHVRTADLKAADAQPSEGEDVLKGRTILIGSEKVTADIPGHLNVPAALVHIFAAETLMSGNVHSLSDIWVLLTAFAILGLVVLSGSTRLKWTGYAVLAGAIPVACTLIPHLGMYVSLSSTFVLLGVYGFLRLRARWRQSVRLIDEATKLPTFLALEADKEVSETMPSLIVARIHRFEEVRKSLPPELHSSYVMRIVDRLRAATPDKTIYAGPGYLIAWTMAEKEPALLREHLEGLRALFAAPLLVGDHQVDVGITFGVDVTSSPDVTRRLAGAVSAAETTNETYDPINVSEIARDEDLIWNISLQARIDSALDNGEIYLLYQPKVHVQTGGIVGVEALVRWRDPQRGLIPPDHFVRQCENVGRMGHLTRHVLREGCMAGNRFAALGMDVPVAINISATMLHERTIVTMVREVLEETGFTPQHLTLEVTETYRISNLERAAGILSDLKALGAKVSMDDFGVGAASLEALMRLPFDELKIDRLFTSAIMTDKKAAHIVESVLAMGRQLGIVVVAEGVENDLTLEKLKSAGCFVAQGFGISRPIAFDELVRSGWIERRRTLQNMV